MADDRATPASTPRGCDDPESFSGNTVDRRPETVFTDLVTATHTSTKEIWERMASSLPAGEADGIEQNAAELGLTIDSPEFFAECIGQAAA